MQNPRILLDCEHGAMVSLRDEMMDILGVGMVDPSLSPALLQRWESSTNVQRIEAMIASNLPTQDRHFWGWVHATLMPFFKSVDEEVIDL